MHLLTWQQLHGINELVRDAVEATTNAVAEADRNMARVPYAILKRVPITTGTAGAVEHIHQAISSRVYDGILAINQLAAEATTEILEWVERTEGPLD
jgi:hypothetical protein